MSLIFKDATYHYPGGDRPACAGVNLRVDGGELVLLTGRTGCGKSTLLRLGAGLLQRHGGGDIKGEILLNDKDPGQLTPGARVRQVAFVAQEPRDQLVAGTVGDEIAFAMESAALDPALMDGKIQGLLQAVGLDISLGQASSLGASQPSTRSTSALSGGQAQRLIVAASLAAGAPILLLDEPLAQLDPKGAADLLKVLGGLRDQGMAILLVEHRLEAALPYADRVVVMDKGQVVATGPGGELEPGGALMGALRGLDLWVPDLTHLKAGLGRDFKDVVFRGQGEAGLKGNGHEDVRQDGALDGQNIGKSQGAIQLDAKGLRVFRGGAEVLRDVSLTLRAGERVALVGANGAGKSTLLLTLGGSLGKRDLRGGDVRCPGRCLSVPQDPDLTLFNASVFEEVAYALREAGTPEAELKGATEKMAQALGIDAYLQRPPQALSRGQRQRVAVAAALIGQPDVLLVDEPTAGLHRGYIDVVLEVMSSHLAEGALVFATHDLSLAARWGTRVLVMSEGRLLRDGSPDVALRGLDPALGLSLPPLMALCEARGLPFLALDALLQRALPGEDQP